MSTGFEKYSNYEEKSSHSSIVFGSGKPVLEVELNELQQIINTKLSRIIKPLGSSIIPTYLGSITFSDNVLTISNSVILEESGLTAYVELASIEVSSTITDIYFKLEEIEATESTNLKSYGNTEGDIIKNTIKDSRSDLETTRRKVVTYTLMESSRAPVSTTTTTKYVKVGHISNGKFNLSDQGIYARKALYGNTTINVGRKEGTTEGYNSTAEGYNTEASGNNSHAEGECTKATGISSHSEGYVTTASGECAHAEGQKTTASGNWSHAEGQGTTASRNWSHAEGQGTTASGNNSHAEGYKTTADSDYSHAEGRETYVSSTYGHAEGSGTQATGTLGDHAEGLGTTASGGCSHAEGQGTTASGMYAHAEGQQTTASGMYAHAEGAETLASGNFSHAEGYKTTALQNQHAQGHFNDTSLSTENTQEGTSEGTAFVIGNGIPFSPSNAFRITGSGKAIGKASFASSGADYAEYFEWQDGNPDNDDRVGYFVTFADGRYIKKANEGDYILGVVSGMPCIIGNNDECWMKQFEMDDFGRFIYETKKETYTTIDIITGKERTEEREVTFYKVNPDYDKEKQYIHRENRQEWSAVGMFGVLSVYDDGTCQVNGYCKCSSNGVATASDTGYRVIERVKDNIIKVVIK